jgi:tetratricopeptide (TPR) repeat protein
LNSAGVKTDERLPSHAASFPRRSSWQEPVVLSAVLLALTLALYLRVNGFPFVNYDDTLYVTQNPVVQDGLKWNTVHWAFTTYHVGTWHPVTWLSHALDCQLFDLDPAGPHDVNLLLHGLNAVLLFWVLWRATGFTWRSFMVAALFALHPINVESVVWVAERKNSLSMLFFLLALGAYRWYVADRKVGRYVVVAVLFALGLMAKPQVITFPFVLLLWDYWPLQRIKCGTASSPSANQRGALQEMTFSQLVLEKLPLFVLAAISGAITMSAQRADGTKITYPLGLRLEYALVSYAQYIDKALWPVRLAPFYPHPEYVALWQAALAGLLIALITAGTIALRRRHPYLIVGWLFFLGTLIPMLGFEGVGYQGKQGIADRYAYLPFIGLFIMICWGVAERASQSGIPVMLLRGVGIAALCGIGMVAYRQLGYWRDNVVLWTHTVQVTKGNFLAENNLGKALLSEGRTEEGIAHFFTAVAIYPSDPVSNLNIGVYEQKRGNYPAAIERYRKTINLTPDRELKGAAWTNLAAVYRQLGDIAAAEQSQAEAASLRR